MEYNYPELNRLLYKRRTVGYSLWPQPLAEVAKQVPKGVKKRLVTRDNWKGVKFIRDGSFMIMEDTLVLKRNETFVGFVTPHKAILYEPKGMAKLLDRYRLPVGGGNLAYAMLLLATLAYYLGWVV